jgi:hypothetical protein
MQINSSYRRHHKHALAQDSNGHSSGKNEFSESTHLVILRSYGGCASENNSYWAKMWQLNSKSGKFPFLFLSAGELRRYTEQVCVEGQT